MICLETLGKLRRRHQVKGEGISAIARDTHLSRNTVRKYVAAAIDEPRYVRKRQPFPQLGPFRDTVVAWLERESQRPERERRTAKRLFEALQQEGYGGGYDSVTPERLRLALEPVADCARYDLLCRRRQALRVDEPIAALKALHLHGMAQALSELAAEQDRPPTIPEHGLWRLIEAE